MSATKFQTAGAEDRISQTVSDAASHAGAAVRDATSQVRDAASDFGARVRSRADDAVGDLAQRVEDQPISALLMAAGIGLIAGLLLGRR